MASVIYEVMYYAPILIPTLNRIGHLKKCIDSLKKNTWSKHTSLIISLDYPSRKEFFEGYYQVKQYLESGIAGFKSVDIIYQKKNQGVIGNGRFLCEYVRNQYDRYIYLEDDNEFSPNFIEYMDRCLERFYNDDKISAICSMNRLYYTQKNNDDIYANPLFLGYGYGCWVHKADYMMEIICNREYYITRYYSLKFLCNMANVSSQVVLSLQSLLYMSTTLFQNTKSRVPYIDVTISIYNMCEGNVCIYPNVSLVKNWGYDGTGANCNKKSVYSHQQEISSDLGFDMPDNGILRFESQYEDQGIVLKCRVIAAVFKIWIFGLRNYKKKINRRV